MEKPEAQLKGPCRRMKPMVTFTPRQEKLLNV